MSEGECVIGGRLVQRSIRRLRPGMVVCSFDSHEVGRVVSVGEDYFVVADKGHRFRLRAEALLSVSGRTATLICYRDRMTAYLLQDGLDGT
jgi:hypothetical protein